jgi:adenylyltransferase/sulfurtransferase
MAFSDEEIERYHRHLILKEVGGPGQQQLKAARVLVIGAGGLGSPILVYLAAAGVGTIGICDDDTVSLSNLQRQIIHDTPSLGEAKVASAARRLQRINPHVRVVPHPHRFDAERALALLADYDLVIDGSDNFATRYLACDACHLACKPLVFAAVGPFDGQLSCFRSYATGADGRPNPTYRCLFPEAPAPGSAPTCAEVGVLGAVVGVIGTLAATEALKLILGIGEPLIGRLLIYDALATRFTTVRYAFDRANPLSGEGRRYVDLAHHSRD